MLIKDQFCIIQNLQTSPIPQTSFLVGNFCRFLQQDGSSTTYLARNINVVEERPPSRRANYGITTVFIRGCCGVWRDGNNDHNTRSVASNEKSFLIEIFAACPINSCQTYPGTLLTA